MRHLTYTGQYAGMTICGAPKEHNVPNGYNLHLAYSRQSDYDDPNMCPRCSHLAQCDHEADEFCQECTLDA